jgi:ABC-type polysaccharide/polyol phosphate export permease
MALAPSSMDRHTSSPSLLARARQLWSRRETVRYLTTSALKAGHRNKVLGHLWNLLDPLMFMLVYFFVFGVLFGLAGTGRGRTIEFMLYILVGILTWRFIQSTIGQSANCIRSNRGLIHEINFPKTVIPVSVTLARLYDFAWGLIVIATFLLIGGVWPTVHYLWVPLLILLALAFTLGVTFIVAYLGAFYADTSNVVDVAMRLLFYCSPIFYYVRQRGDIPSEKVFLRNHEWLHYIYMSNPIACFFECFRDALLWGLMPEPRLMFYVAGVSVVTLCVGFAVFCHGEGKFAKYV